MANACLGWMKPSTAQASAYPLSTAVDHLVEKPHNSFREIPLEQQEDLWITAVADLRKQLSDGVWQSTFAGIQALSSDTPDALVRVSVPSQIVKDRLETRYLALVTGALQDAGANPDVEIVIEVRTEQAHLDVEEDAAALLHDDFRQQERSGATSDTRNANTRNGRVQPADPMETAKSLNPRLTFESFVTGPSNRFAHAAALSVAETPGRSYNPLFIHGDAGLGKTHLLQGIAQYVLENYPEKKVLYVSTETFLNEFVDAIRTNTTHAFKRRYREIDVLLVDDIQFIEGKEGIQEEFFHTFNTLHQANRQVVISSDRPPDAISTLEDRLRSRFKMGLITDIQPPDVETRLAILRTRAESDRIRIDDDILEFIATNVKDNIRELEGALIRATAFARLTNEPLTLELAKNILSDLVTDTRPQIVTPQLILDETSLRFGFTIEEIKGGSRKRPLVISRQIAMYVMRQLTDLSYPAIAREFGGRDHTTVIHAVDKIDKLMSERRQIYDQVTEILTAIKTGTGRAAA